MFSFDLFIGTCLVPPLLVAVSDRDVLEDSGVWTYRPVYPVVIIRFWPLSCDVSLRVLTWGFLETVLGEHRAARKRLGASSLSARCFAWLRTIALFCGFP